MILDATDLRLLHFLQQDGRISNQELAEKVALSPSACLRRLRLLESEGIISGYRAVLNAEQLGIELEAIVHLSLRQDVEDWHETFIKKVQGWPEGYPMTWLWSKLRQLGVTSLFDSPADKLDQQHIIGVFESRTKLLQRGEILPCLRGVTFRGGITSGLGHGGGQLLQGSKLRHHIGGFGLTFGVGKFLELGFVQAQG